MSEGKLLKLEDSMRAVGTQNRLVLQLGEFDVFIHQDSDDYFLSFAVPKGETNAIAVQVMMHAFKKYDRRARLEYFQELHPDLAALLEAEGFSLDMCAPVMVLSKDAFSLSLTQHKAVYRRLTAHDEKVLSVALRQQSIAYGGLGAAAALVWLEGMLVGLKQETLLVSILELEGGFVSGASIQIGGGVGELAGVWTHPDFQRQGLAFELCAQLLEDYFKSYDLCWLSAAEAAEGLYKNLGFQTLATQLNYGLRF